MPPPNKPLTLAALLFIFSIGISWASGDQSHRRVLERSVSQARRDGIGRNSYDASVVAALLGNSLFRVLCLSHTPAVPPSPSRPSSPFPDQPPSERVKAFGLDPEVLGRIAPFDRHITRHSLDLGIDPNLTRAVIYVESKGDPRARSHRGARGLMQLMPDTAVRLGIRNAYDPGQNILGGVLYLRSLLDQFHNVELALWGYNAGPGTVERRSVPMETRRYIPEVLRVKAALDRLAGRPTRVRSARLIETSGKGLAED